MRSEDTYEVRGTDENFNSLSLASDQVISLTEPDHFGSTSAKDMLETKTEVETLEEFKSEVVSNLNKTFTDDCIFLIKSGRQLILKCTYKACPYEYAYKYTQTNGKISKIMLHKKICDNHSF